MKELEDQFTKKQLAKLLDDAWKSRAKLIQWLYENHKEVLREYEDEYYPNLRIEFLGMR